MIEWVKFWLDTHKDEMVIISAFIITTMMFGTVWFIASLFFN